MRGCSHGSRTVVQDFAGATAAGWRPEPVGLGFPLIAKAANSADYERLSFTGKKKVYQVEDQAELDELWARLVEVGFTGRFVVQEMIPGDDTQMRSITCYVDSHGSVTLSCCAHVLLEEHTPSGLGNPAAMITGRWDGMLEQAQRLLTSTGYVGFANFDVKVDPRDGSAQFFEVNPRIGRNNYYVTAAGANPVRFLVEDRVDGTAVEPVVVEREVLYSILPYRLLRRYVLDPDLRAKADALVRSGATAHPLRYRAETRLKRRAYVALAAVNQIRKFRRYYPEVTTTGL
jgi:D-aspartate ligase